MATSNKNAISNLVPDSLFILREKGNPLDSLSSSGLDRGQQHASAYKDVAENYATTSRMFGCVKDLNESGNMKSFIPDKKVSTSSFENCNVQRFISRTAKLSGKCKAASDVDSTSTLSDDDFHIPSYFEGSEKTIFLHNTHIPTTRDNKGNVGFTRGLRIDSFQSILINDDEPVNKITAGIVPQACDNNSNHICTNNKPLVPDNSTEDSCMNVEAHFQPENRRFICPICEKAFSFKSHYLRHYRTHTGETPYACDQCAQKFSRKERLDRHRHTHTGERPYACDRCRQKFSQKGNLDIHRRTHTGERPYACNQCRQKFSHKGNLNIHRRTHTGERPYACDQCQQKFSQKESLDRHRRTHTGRCLINVPYVEKISWRSVISPNT